MSTIRDGAGTQQVPITLRGTSTAGHTAGPSWRGRLLSGHRPGRDLKPRTVLPRDPPQAAQHRGGELVRMWLLQHVYVFAMKRNVIN